MGTVQAWACGRCTGRQEVYGQHHGQQGCVRLGWYLCTTGPAWIRCRACTAAWTSHIESNEWYLTWDSKYDCGSTAPTSSPRCWGKQGPETKLMQPPRTGTGNGCGTRSIQGICRRSLGIRPATEWHPTVCLRGGHPVAVAHPIDCWCQISHWTSPMAQSEKISRRNPRRPLSFSANLPPLDLTRHSGWRSCRFGANAWITQVLSAQVTKQYITGAAAMPAAQV